MKRVVKIEGIKYLFLVIGSFYFFIKMLNIDVTKNQLLQIAILSSLTAVCGAVINTIQSVFTIAFLALCVLFFCVTIFKIQLKLTITCSIVSFGVSYASSMVAVLLIAIMFSNINPDGNRSNLYTLIVFLITGIIHIVLIYLPFKLKRYKKGLPFLYSYANEDVAVYISTGILLFILSLSFYQTTSITTVIPVTGVLILGLFLVFWWRNRIKQEYLTHVRMQEVQYLKDELEQSKKELKKLGEDKDELAKIVHKDNKLIPALELSVRTLLQNKTEGEEHDRENTEKLLQQLESLTRDRKGILKSRENQTINIKETGYPSVDSVINYLYAKAQDKNIKMDFSIKTSLETIIDRCISIKDFETVLADVIENAIIATDQSENRCILLHWGFEDGVFAVSVYDSAPPFASEVLKNFGKQKTTTHKHEGGSGIGLFSLYEIANKTKASVEISQSIISKTYTKKVGIVFDDKSETRIPKK